MQLSKAREAKAEEASLKKEEEAAKAAAKAKAESAKVEELNKVETQAVKSAGGALGKVSGSAQGGRVLPKEEISSDMLNMLKKYN